MSKDICYLSVVSNFGKIVLAGVSEVLYLRPPRLDNIWPTGVAFTDILSQRKSTLKRKEVRLILTHSPTLCDFVFLLTFWSSWHTETLVGQKKSYTEIPINLIPWLNEKEARKIQKLLLTSFFY